MFCNKKSIIAAASILLGCSFAGAQNLTPSQQSTLRSSEYNSGTELSQRIREIQRMRAETKAREALKNKQTEPDKPALQTTKPNAPKIRMYLEKLEIPDSEVLSRKALDAVAAKFERKEIEVSDLYDAINEINKLYASKGYLTAKAVIQPQKTVGGTVKITLLEGKLGEAHIINNRITKSKYIESYLQLEEGKVPNMNRLRHRLQRFNGTNSTVLQIRMVAGKTPMTTDFYIVAIEPAHRDRFSIFSDNAGKESSGEWRYGLSYTNSNHSGVCDQMNLTFLAAKTSETGIFSYNLPLDGKGNSLGLNYSENRMRISDGDMRELDIRGESKSYSVSLNHPTLTTASRKENAVFEIQQQHSSTTVFGNQFAHDDERRLALSYDSLVMHGLELFYIKPQFSYNSYRGLAENQFGTRFILDALWQKYKTNGDTMTIRFNGQKAFDDYIPSADQYYLGGLYTVRGYEESGIGGDSGYNAKIDHAWHTKIKDLKFVTFFDWGRLAGDDTPKTKEIYSAGWGLEYRHKDLAITATVGYALKRHINDVKADASNVNVTASYLF